MFYVVNHQSLVDLLRQDVVDIHLLALAPGRIVETAYSEESHPDAGRWDVVGVERGVE